MSKEIAALELRQVATPADPATGYQKLYVKSDGRVWCKQVAIAEKRLLDGLVQSSAPSSPASGDLWVDSGSTVLTNPQNPTVNTGIGFIVQGLASQSGDLQQWLDSGSVVLARVASDGLIYEGGRRVSGLTSRLTSAPTTTSATYAGTGLSVTVLAGKAYRIRAYGGYRSSVATVGIGLRVNGTATATRIRYNSKIYGVTASPAAPTYQHVTTLGATVALTTAVATINTDYPWEIDGVIVVNAGGTITIEHACETATGSPTVTTQIDSVLELREIA